jgi:hypothetical protein
VIAWLPDTSATSYVMPKGELGGVGELVSTSAPKRTTTFSWAGRDGATSRASWASRGHVTGVTSRAGRDGATSCSVRGQACVGPRVPHRRVRLPSALASLVGLVAPSAAPRGLGGWAAHVTALLSTACMSQYLHGGVQVVAGLVAGVHEGVAQREVGEDALQPWRAVHGGGYGEE